MSILTFHLSPILPELRWQVLRYVWLNPRMSQWVQWFFSLPSVAWDDFARARPAHSMRETVRARGKPLTASDSPILWAGCNRAKIVPCYRWGNQCTGIAPTVRGFGHKYPILASSYFNKVFLLCVHLCMAWKPKLNVEVIRNHKCCKRWSYLRLHGMYI